MNKITLCLAYYENPGMLRRQFEQLADLPEDLRASIELIVVDDGSPTWPAADVDRVVVKLGRAGDTEGAAPLVSGFRLFRMGVDVPWNMDACRNLAVSQASTDWVLLTDIDHLVPAKTWRKIVAGALDRSKAYKFARVSEPDLAPYKPHPNTWLMTRETYDRAGGYDERLAGWYGTDGDFRNRVVGVAPVIQLKEPVIRVPRDVTPDASTTTLVRRSPENAAGLDKAKRDRDLIKGWRPLRNSFPWVREI